MKRKRKTVPERGAPPVVFCKRVATCLPQPEEKALPAELTSMELLNPSTSQLLNFSISQLFLRQPWISGFIQTGADSIGDDAGKVLGPGFFEDDLAVAFDGFDAQVEIGSDLFAGVLQADQPGDLPFAVAERSWRRRVVKGGGKKVL